jgi:hypothetical protein
MSIPLFLEEIQRPYNLICEWKWKEPY